jgi:AraC-like DNA-binding protein
MSGPETLDPEFELVLDNAEVTALSLDREGNLWLGTRNDGLKYRRPILFTTFDVGQAEEASQDLVDIHQDARGRIWTGNRFGTLFRWEEGAFRAVSLERDPFDETMFIMADGPEGGLLFGTEHQGVWMLNSEGLAPYLTSRGPIDRAIASLFRDRWDRLWVGRLGLELGYHDAERYVRVLDRSTHPGKMVFDFLEDSRGNLWIGGTEGVVLLPDGDPDPEGLVRLLPGVPVLALHEDETGTIWMASPSGGLIRMDPESFHHLSIGTEEGLGCDEIVQLLEDDQGYFWLVCPRGILRVSRAELAGFSGRDGGGFSVAAFNLSDGVRGMGLAGTKIREGHLLFATDQGVVAVDPSRVSLNAVPPGVVIHSATVDGRVGKSPSGGAPLEMKSGGLLQIEARAVTFRGTEALTYRYRLEGEEDGWTRVFNAGALTVQYPKLKPGDYLFRVTAANNHGVWSEETTSLAISVQPTLLQKTWFRTLFLLAVLSALGASGRFVRKRQERLRNKYHKARISEEAAAVCHQALLRALEVEGIYRDRDLSLNSLARCLGVAPHHLSQVINQRFQKNYPQLINEYRVREAKRILLADGEKDPKIITIAFQVGFNTLNSFNRAFKKQVGMTPTQFRKEHRGP